MITVVAALSVLAAACGGSGESGSGEPDDVDTYSGYVVDPPSQVGDVALPTAADGTEESVVAEPGGLEVVYFGYTFCPDVCPTTMSDLRRALAELPTEEAERVDVTMITIDPARDTPEVITDYVHTFIDDGTALRTEDDTALRAAADAFGANYSVETGDDGEIEVAHTGELYAVDGSGTVVMQWPFGTSAESMTRDLRSLLAEAESA